uniref:Transmembrane domain-containing protein n=1 Tax=Spironucleus salmonicida TaxID=348837 RepID=V6M4M3_9EUKA|eukprot:EST48294.1 Transmembrane domain-containing protein [Spironucleus salmonicida]
MTDSLFTHIMFFLLTASSTGYLFGFTLLEKNLGMSKFTFTTAAVGFATSGLVFHLGLLDKMVRKLSLRPVLWIAMAIQQAGLTLCQFPAVHPQLHCALLTSCGCCMLYSALFYLYGNFMYFGVVSSIAFAASTTFFYFSALSQYYLIGLQLLSVTSLALFFPKYPSSYWQQEKRKLLHKSQVLTLAVFGSIFSKNLMTVSYFSFDKSQLVFSLGLASSVLSGLFLFNLRVGMVIFASMAVVSCILNVFNNVILIQLGFYLANIAAGGFISGAMALNSQENVMRDNGLIYLALICGNISGFLEKIDRIWYQACYEVCMVLIVVGMAGVFMVDTVEKASVEEGTRESGQEDLNLGVAQE